ncbi:hypothetical protein [Klebsiella aerogenes]|uniref:hypothetical protein n=1 Tax=Klebsiella aerogenes TaxID=548 RepID=UPI0019D00D3E|nr:hypothetical protein [Klebsiella aerogenes]
MTSQLTRERLQEIAEDGFLKHGESKELARMALAAMDSEPVAYIGEKVLEDMAEGYCGRVWPFNKDELSGESRIPLYRHAQLAPAVPVEATIDNKPNSSYEWRKGWNACLAAMLQAEPVTTANKLGNSPVIPDGYVMVPREPTAEMIWAAKYAIPSTVGWQSFKDVYIAMLAAAPQEVGDA